MANGRTVAGVFQVASVANPEVGFLDVIIVRYGNMLDLAGVGARLLPGNYFDSDQITHRNAQRVRIVSHPGMWFTVDGELFTNQPITFTNLPQTLRVVVGTAYSANPQAS